MGGKFNFKHFIDPLGVSIGKGEGGGAKNFLDPAGAFTGKDSPGVDETVAGATPPVDPNSPDVMRLQQDFLRQSMLRKSIRKTTVAGETGGFKPAAAAGPGG